MAPSSKPTGDPHRAARDYLGGRRVRAVDETRAVLAFGLACGGLLWITWRSGTDLGVAWLLLVPLSIALAIAKERWLRRGAALLASAADALEAGDLARAETLLAQGATGRYSKRQVAVFLTALAGVARTRGDIADADELTRSASALRAP